jgi:hypothetical protein
VDHGVIYEDVDQLRLVSVAHGEDLVVDRDHTVGTDPTQHPLAAVVLGCVDRDGRGVGGDGDQPEPLRRSGHLQGLVRTHRVVVLDPCIQRCLGGLEGGEGSIGEELPAQALMEPLDLAGGGGRADRGVAVGDAILPADPVE